MSTDKRQQAVVAALLSYGHRQRSAGGLWYTSDRAADRFVRKNPNARLFGVIFDQGIPAGEAWSAPWELRRRLGHFSMHRLARTPLSEIRRAVRGRNEEEKALHRFIRKLSRWLKAAASKLVKEYRSDARNIWRGCRTAGEVIRRLEEFSGIGQKKAHMTARGLAENGAGFSRWQDINVAVDVHLKRVFRRAGLVRKVTSGEVLAAAARLHPRYPGELDWPAWLIGQDWCRPRKPDCDGDQRDDGRPCPLRRVCPKEARGPLALGY